MKGHALWTASALDMRQAALGKLEDCVMAFLSAPPLLVYRPLIFVLRDRRQSWSPKSPAVYGLERTSKQYRRDPKIVSNIIAAKSPIFARLQTICRSVRGQVPGQVPLNRSTAQECKCLGPWALSLCQNAAGEGRKHDDTPKCFCLYRIIVG